MNRPSRSQPLASRSVGRDPRPARATGAHPDRIRSTSRVSAIVMLALLGACSGTSDVPRSQAGGDGALSGAGGDKAVAGGSAAGTGGAGLAGMGASDVLELQPKQQTVRVKHGEPLPSVQFQVRSGNGSVVTANFRLDDGALGDIDESGVFTPNGLRAGTTRVQAQAGRTKLSAELTVELEWIQNGGSPDPNAGMVAGGYAGVGGEGPGTALDAGPRAVLDGTPSADAALKWLYPYDGTVFPLGLLAPLLMWSESTGGVADGVRVRLSGPHFEYRGYFGRPAALAASAPFVRHPIPQDAWDAATGSLAGGVVKLELTVSKAGVAYGPLKQQWTIARGSLKGTVYYQSYGTHLAKNATGAIGGDGKFGGATLSIRVGAASPELVAGRDGGDAECRVCHSVSSNGSRMTVQHGDQSYDPTSSIDLLGMNRETAYPASTNKQLAWIGLTPDGALGLGNGAPLAVTDAPDSQLYDMTTGDAVTAMALTSFVTKAAFPAFSHDGKKVAFNFYAGPGNAGIGAGDTKKLVAMDFDPMSRTFSNPVLLYGQAKPAGWPAFTPTGTGVVYQLELARGDGEGFFYTRNGGTGELWWTNLRTGAANALELANGTRANASYLPRGASHEADHQLNFEPSVAPIASGGYAWMVFTSRRSYGNVATLPPWDSDPRKVDLTSTPTTKKLWIAAVDLDVDTPELPRPVGPDPSHPAFYLPGQELLAGNARGFWVVDPCRADGKGCETGVECCSGVCQKDAQSGKLTCGPKTNDCVEVFGRCDSAADCCDVALACVNHVCTQLLQ